jgi:cytochrome c2
MKKLFLIALLFVGCETTNYAPLITSTKPNSKLERGRTLFVHRCIECHTLPAIWKYSREDWPKIVNDMLHRASLNPAEREAVIAYILAVRKQQ